MIFQSRSFVAIKVFFFISNEYKPNSIELFEKMISRFYSSFQIPFFLHRARSKETVINF